VKSPLKRRNAPWKEMAMEGMEGMLLHKAWIYIAMQTMFLRVKSQASKMRLAHFG
jgi:hypothetical protein